MLDFQMFLNKDLSGAELPVGLWHRSVTCRKVDKLLKRQRHSGSEANQRPAQRGELTIIVPGPARGQ